MSGEPIFVVGAPRSGTTLLAAQLAAHSKLSCGPETHFFRWFAQADAAALLQPTTWPAPALDFIGAIRYRQFDDQSTAPLIKKYGVTAAQIESALRQMPPSAAAMLASITEPYMRALGKVRWVEKTPDHIEHLPLIRRHFPASPIIRIVRDPRDVALSLTRVPWGASSLNEALLYVRKLDAIATPFFASDQNSHTLRFEDLLANPQHELQKICRFIGEAFEEGMLNTTESGQRVNSRNAPWKEKASQPIDKGRIAVWRKELSAAQNQVAEAIAGDLLERYDYPRTENFSRYGTLFPTDQMLLKYGAELQALVSRGIRLWQRDRDEAPSVKIYVGNPSHVSWLGERQSRRLARALSVAAEIVRARRSGQDLYWITDRDLSSWSGVAAQLIMHLLKPHKLVLQPNLESES